MLTELITLGLATIVAFAVVKIFNSVFHLVMNAAVGITVLLLAKYIIGIQIAINMFTIGICTLGGALGAFAMIALNHLEIAFV